MVTNGLLAGESPPAISVFVTIHQWLAIRCLEGAPCPHQTRHIRLHHSDLTKIPTADRKSRTRHLTSVQLPTDHPPPVHCITTNLTSETKPDSRLFFTGGGGGGWPLYSAAEIPMTFCIKVVHNEHYTRVLYIDFQAWRHEYLVKSK